MLFWVIGVIGIVILELRHWPGISNWDTVAIAMIWAALIFSIEDAKRKD